MKGVRNCGVASVWGGVGGWGGGDNKIILVLSTELIM